MSASPASLHFFFALFLFGATALLATGCGSKDEESAQVIATVDGQNINMRQMSDMLSKADGVTPENISNIKLKLLDALVEQQLAVNLALEKKLDRKPEVQSAIEASRREILAQAALDQISVDLPLVSDDDARKYYADNPALFGDRRIFTVQEVTLKKAGTDVAQLRTQIASTKRIDDVTAWLKDKKIEFNSNSTTRSAEQIPSDVLPKFQSAKEGQLILMDGVDTFTVARLVSVRAQPISSAKALAAITTFLSRQRAADAVSRATLEMKAKAKLAYFGEFVGGEAAFKARAETDAKIAAAVEVQIKAKARAEGDALAEHMASQQADSQTEQDARDKARASSGKWQAPTRAEAIILEQGIKGL